MRRDLLLILGLVLLLFAGSAEAADDDTLIYNDGKEKKVTVTKETKDTIRIRGGDEVDATKVWMIAHGDSVPDYDRARGALLAGRYSTAASGFEKAKELSEPEWVEPYATFYLAEAYRNQGRADKMKLGDAIATYESFLSDFGDHFLLPHVLYGLAEAHRHSGNESQALDTYKKLADGSAGEHWRLWGKYGVGIVQLDRNPGEALKEFEIVSSAASTMRGLEGLYRLAAIGKGRAYMAERQYGKAIDHFKRLIGEGGSAQDTAGAYNNMAECFLKEGSGRDAKFQALHAYLSVAVLYPGAGAEYAKALYEGAQLAEELGMADRAEQLRKELKQRCPESEYAQKL